MQSLYNIISTIGLMFYLPFLLLKKGPENKNRFIRERLGLSGYKKTDIWVHTVSVGETLASIPFLKKLKKEFPYNRVVMTTTTYTGQKIARAKFPEADRIMYMPLDSPLCINRAVSLLSPDIFITVETELWPALFHSLKRAGSRIIILNGRISDKSFKGYRRISQVMGSMLSKVDFFYMQGTVDAARIITLGASGDKVGIMGNFKFDMDFRDTGPVDWLSGFDGEILLGASTHEGEEKIILDAFTAMKNNMRGIKLILAPRHPERFDEAAKIMDKMGLQYVRRSRIKRAQNASEGRPNTVNGEFPDIILLDTLGELSRVFANVSVALIGGSLVPRGGHNIMEPAYWSKPIIFGPHMENFPIAQEFIDRGAALRVRNPADIADTVTELFSNREKAVQMGRNARAIVDENAGAVNKAVELIRSYIGTV